MPSILQSLADDKLLQEQARLKTIEAENELPQTDDKNDDSYVPDATDDEIKRELTPKNKYQPLAFQDPVELLYCLFQPIRDGLTLLHDWQVQELVRISNTSASPQNRFQYSLVANNGSGKDSYLIAPFAVFQTCCKIRSRTIITSASYAQLSLQTESYIRMLCQQINDNLKEAGICDRAFWIKKQHIVCTLTGSEIVLFVTDEGGRAEGYHPFPDYPKGEVTVILNEAKTVPDIIYDSLGRCTYSRWLEISSTGRLGGMFYQHFSFKNTRHFPQDYIEGCRYARRITSYDCPHIHINTIKQDELELGVNNPVFRSKHLSLFTSVDEQVVITREFLDSVRSSQIDVKLTGLKLGRRAGLDLAAGGDENALYVFDENICIGSEVFRAKDTAEVTVPVLIKFFNKYKLIASNIYGDDGGVGHAIIDNLRREGWPINIVRNQSSPVRRGEYGNRGAELWFNFALIVQYLKLPLDTDEKLFNQLSSRYYTQHKTLGKIILESKKEARVKGHGSPDRADAVVLAFTGITAQDFMEALGRGEKVKGAEDNGKELMTADKLSEAIGRLRNPPVGYYMESTRNSLRKDVKRLNPVNLINSLYN